MEVVASAERLHAQLLRDAAAAEVRLSAAQATLRESGGRIAAERAALRGLTAKPSAPGASKPRLSTAVLASEVLLHLQT